MALFSAAELAAATGGCWLETASVPTQLLAISTDTRSDNRGKIFFALSGEKFDAHNFLYDAVTSQCEALCIKREKQKKAPEGIPVLLVDDPLIAMQKCASFHRCRFKDLTVFGVTGSVGKTSVKEMIYAICAYAAGADKTLATIGNTNNQVGVAQNLLRLTEKHRFAIIEAGTSSPGEIAPLSQMMIPDGAIVNSIAPCHLEKLIDLDGVAREKSTIFNAVPLDGAAVFPAATAGKNILVSSAGARKICTFGINKNGDVYANFISGTLDGSTFELFFPNGEMFTINWHLTGVHNALNAAGAAALCYLCGIAPQIIAAALPTTVLPGMRMKKTILNGITFYNDAYNANPASMHASVELLASTPLNGRLFLLLGGMRELGAVSRNAHTALLAEIREKLPDAQIITVGNEFDALNEHHFSDPNDAGKFLLTQLQKNDTVFAKGSRGNAVEKALPMEAR